MRHEKVVSALEIASTEGKRSRGRPAKSDALSPAERAKKYREKQKRLRTVSDTERDGNDVTENAVKTMQEQLRKVQMRYDLEHLKVIELQAELATLKRRIEKPADNPLATQVVALRKTVSEQAKIISASNAEINNLRDDIRSSRKKTD